MLPKGYLIGNLTADPVSGVTGNSNNYARFSVACNDAFIKQNQPPKTHFYNCIAWNKRAQYISSYLKKGDTVFLEYNLVTNSYTNAEGRVIRGMDLSIEKVELLSKKSSRKAASTDGSGAEFSGEANTSAASSGTQTPENSVELDDIFNS